jgi:hypothetical protein
MNCVQAVRYVNGWHLALWRRGPEAALPRS